MRGSSLVPKESNFVDNSRREWFPPTPGTEWNDPTSRPREEKRSEEKLEELVLHKIINTGDGNQLINETNR